MTIRGRLLVLLLPGLVVVLMVGGFTVYIVARANLRRQMDEGLLARAESLASLVAVIDYDSEWLEFEFDEDPTIEAIGRDYFEYRMRTGFVLLKSDAIAETELPMPDIPRDANVYQDVALPGGVFARAVWHSFQPRVEDAENDDSDDDGVVHGVATGNRATVVVMVADDRAPMNAALATLAAALLAVGGAAAATAGLLVLIGVRWGLRPLRTLKSQIEAIGSGGALQRADGSAAPRELAPVYDELNRLLDRVEQTLERERSFANAAAHELRTPLAELRAGAEVALRWPDHDRAGAALRETLAIAGEMEKLVESLLLISKGNRMAIADESSPVRLKPIIAGCFARTNGAAEAKALHIDIDLDDSDSVSAPRDAIEIIVRNLIDNAVRYTPDHGRISVRDGHQGNGSPILVVENGPVDLTPADLERLFEPFWRTEASRSDRTHVGLGLTVVQQFAQAIGLRVEARLEGDCLQMHMRHSQERCNTKPHTPGA